MRCQLSHHPSKQLILLWTTQHLVKLIFWNICHYMRFNKIKKTRYMEVVINWFRKCKSRLLQSKVFGSLQFLISQWLGGKVLQKLWRQNRQEPHLWRREEARLIHEMSQLKLLAIVHGLWNVWQRQRDAITTKLLTARNVLNMQ